MASETDNAALRTIVPIGKVTVNNPAAELADAAGPLPARTPGEIFRPLPVKRAPAWFYSALCWLGKTYYDASNDERGFGPYLIGADVDPYRQLGATRLFTIAALRTEFSLTLAADRDSDAPLTGGSLYPATDAGILQMYRDLAASNIFASVSHCYIPGRVDLAANAVAGVASAMEVQFTENLVGYDPATGLRRILLGSAIAQVVPLDDFALAHNQQIYDQAPKIVPLATSLVYDVTTNNQLDATSFVLPVVYVVDQATAGQYGVSRYGATLPATPGQVDGAPRDYGQTAVFPGGPGFDAARATQLAANGPPSPVSGTDHSFITTPFADSTAYTIANVGGSVVPGVSVLTYNSTQPLALFSLQRIIGFYRDNGWQNSLGQPIFDYQQQNSAFAIAETTPPIAPELVYDPQAPFLNGGALPNVLAKFQAANYILAPERLLALIDGAASYAQSGSPAGLSAMTAQLLFDTSSSPVAGISDQLAVPLTVTVTTTPQPVAAPAPQPPAPAPTPQPAPRPNIRKQAKARKLAPSTIIARFSGEMVLEPVGQGGTSRPTTPAAPSVVQLGLEGFVPIEALAGTGIAGIPIGTIFPAQMLGDGAAFRAAASGTVLNLCDAHRRTPPFAQIQLQLADAQLSLVSGALYVFHLSGQTLTVRGPDETVQTAALGKLKPDPKHDYVGAAVYGDGLASVALYPILSLSLAAPAVDLSGVEQGQAYSVRLTYGTDHATVDILDSDQIAVVTGLAVAKPTPTDKSRPQAGDIYFGSFLGGAETLTVWAVPVFLAVSPTTFPGVSFDGSLALGAVSSGLPTYSLTITDSSLFVFTNINLDGGSAGSLSRSNVYAAGIAINSAPDSLSADAFAPTDFVLGVVRQAQVGAAQTMVFVPQADSLLIDGKRYMASAIEIEKRTDDPTQRAYPANFWPDSRFWQFANRHNPYLDIRYTGETQDARILRAQADTTAIGADMQARQEPLHMFLDTGDEMTIWPILGFPCNAGSVTPSQVENLAAAIVALLQTHIPPQRQSGGGMTAAERVILPPELVTSNPYSYGFDFSTASAAAGDGANTSGSVTPPAATVTGKQVKNLSPGINFDTTATGIDAIFARSSLSAQQATAAVGEAKLDSPLVDIQLSPVAASGVLSAVAQLAAQLKQPPAVFGFSVYNGSSGEVYLIELVPSDLAIPDQLPNPTNNQTYDPYYVRVVFLRGLKAYNMSIIVPSIAYDQYGHLAQAETEPAYANRLAKTDDFALGYMASLHNSTGRFDSLEFTFAAGEDSVSIGDARKYVYTNVPYRSATLQGEVFLAAARQLPLTFACRRLNWKADCALMVATRPQDTHVYLAFGGGDIAPMRLDAQFTADKRLPAHLYQLTTTFPDKQYDAAQTISIANVPYVISVGMPGPSPVFSSFAINTTADTGQLQIGNNVVLEFPGEIYVVGQASTTLTDISDTLGDTTAFFTPPADFPQPTASAATPPVAQQFKAIVYNNLVYLVRAVSDCAALATIGGLACRSGLLIDTFVPTTTGTLDLAQGARYKRSGMQFFGESYTPTTMVDSLDTLDFTSITGEIFKAPTIFIPIPELDATKGFVADIANFVGGEFWTFLYPEITAQPGQVVNGVSYPDGFNRDQEGKPVLSLQKLHFVYDPLAVLFTPNDLTHKYTLQPKQQVLALTNSQIREGLCWRGDHIQQERTGPHTICAQQQLPEGWGRDRPNIIYSLQNTPVQTAQSAQFLGLSVNSFVSVAGAVYNIEEALLGADQTGGALVSTVSSVANMMITVLFDYDNNALDGLAEYDAALTNKGAVFLNGYLSATGYNFSSPDHFDVDDVLPSQVPLLDQVANLLGNDFAYYNTDLSLPRQYWSLTYDALTAPGAANYIPNVPPSLVDPTFSNRTRSLLLNFENQVRPQAIGVMDTHSSVVSINLHLQNGVTASVFVSKKADRDVASIGTNPMTLTVPSGPSYPLSGLQGKYDFFLFSRDHYFTLNEASFELIDQGYAMCLVDDGTGTGNKIAQYYVDADGNYNELFTYVLYSPDRGVLETNSFPLKVTLAAPANLAAVPTVAETPNNVNPQDLAAQINKLSNLIYAVFGPATPGQAPAYIPIQSITGGSLEVQAAPISGQPGFNGYSLNVVGTNKQPVQISQIYSANIAYPIAGLTTLQPYDPKKQKLVPFYGSLSHGLDKQVQIDQLVSTDGTLSIDNGTFGGNGQGALIGTPLSWAFRGSAAAPAQPTQNAAVGSTMKADDGIFYTFNAVTNIVTDSSNKSVTAGGGQYFIDTTDPENPIWVIVTLPKFQLNANSYVVNLGTTLPDGVTPRYTLVVGDKSYPFDADNIHVSVDRTQFTFNKPQEGGVFTVTYASLDAPETNEAPSPITLTPFTIAAGGPPASGQLTMLDVFNDPNTLKAINLGVIGRVYAYDAVKGLVTVTNTAGGGTTVSVALHTGLVFASGSGYGYVIGFEGGVFTVNGSPMFRYKARTTGSPASHPLMTAPQMFTFGKNFYTFDVAASGAYASVTGNGSIYPINPYQFSLNGEIYILNTSVQPNTVSGGGKTIAMSANNTQFLLDDVQYTVALNAGSWLGATISGQFNIAQGNVVAIEDHIYLLDTLNGQIVGNGTSYPLSAAGATYTISTANRSFTVTTEPNAATVTIGNIVYQINNSTVVGDGIPYPIIPYRTFVDPDFNSGTKYVIGNDGVVMLPQPLSIAGGQFTDAGVTYTIDQVAAFDGADYHPISGTVPQFTTPATTFVLRPDAVAVTVGGGKSFFVNTGAIAKTQIGLGPRTLFFGRATDNAAFNGTQYFAVANSQFTDTSVNPAKLYTLVGNTAVCDGNSYEIYSNLGQGAYFTVPGGSTFYINIPVADFGTADGGIFDVFPLTGHSLTIPLQYTVTIAGGDASVDSWTFGAATLAAGLDVADGGLSGGTFSDPVTGITYLCVRDGGQLNFVDSNNAVYPLDSDTGIFVAQVPVVTAATVALDQQSSAVYPVQNNSFIAGTTTYKVNVPVASANPAQSFWPLVAGRFIVPQPAPLSNIAYRIVGDKAIKGYVVSEDDQFSPDETVVYAVNDVNVVKASSQAKLTGAAPNQTVTFPFAGDTLRYALDPIAQTATTQPPALKYDAAAKSFSVDYPGQTVAYTVAYTVGAGAVTDSRATPTSFPTTLSGNEISFTDTISGAGFAFDSSGNNPIAASFAYQSQSFTDVLNGITFYVDTDDTLVEALLYLPETTRYSFTPADGHTYLIHYDAVDVVFPVIAGTHVNAGVATVGANIFTLEIDEIDQVGTDTAAPAIPINRNSFEINGELYTITPGQNGTDYSACTVVGADKPPFPFTGPDTFRLSDATVTYTLHLDADGLPETISASFCVQPSQDLISVADEIFIITYGGVTTGMLRGQGQSAVPITNSAFTLKNRFDKSQASFIFADADIYDASAVLGQFTVYQAPTFAIAGTTFTFDPTNGVVTDRDGRPYPLIANPMMFSLNGSNYLIDTNQIPHAIVGNNERSEIATDLTVQAGKPIANSTFPMGGQIYAYVEDDTGALLAIRGTKSYMITQQAKPVFKLDSSLLFTLDPTPPAAPNYPGSVVPIGTVSAGIAVCNVYAGTPESGGADFFTYKNVLYTLVKSNGTYEAVQKTYTIYASAPATNQQQLAVFDMNGTTYIVTDGSTAGIGTPAGINPGSMWSATATSTSESQMGLVYGLTAAPTTVIQAVDADSIMHFQFPATDSAGNTILFDIDYAAGATTNQVIADVPNALPSFTQAALFDFMPAGNYAPLTFQTGGYNAYVSAVAETAAPAETFSAAWRTPVTSSDADAIDKLISAQGDFSVGFWHSIPVTGVSNKHMFTYQSSANKLISYADISFPNASDIVVTVNGTVMWAQTTAPVFSSGWRHVALTYTQPYVMICDGAPFVVENGSAFDFERDFTIVMTLSANDITAEQGLLYKGNATEVPPAQTQASYRVTMAAGGALVLDIFGMDDASAAVSFAGPTIQADTTYQVMITKHTNTPLGADGADSDPYGLPISPADIADAMNGQNVSLTLNKDNSITGNPTPTIAGLNKLTTPVPSGYTVTFALREVYPSGGYGPWDNSFAPIAHTTSSDDGLLVLPTGPVPLVIGGAYDDKGAAQPFGNANGVGNILEVQVFSAAIRSQGIRTGQSSSPILIENATSSQLQGAGLIGWWKAAYDPDGIVANLLDDSTPATPSNSNRSFLAPLPGREAESIALYVNGTPVTLGLISSGSGYTVPSGPSSLTFNAKPSLFWTLDYKIQEISFWNMARQPFQVVSDMFGQLIFTNEPALTLYLPGSWSPGSTDTPILPVADYLDNQPVMNGTAYEIAFHNATRDLQGCPAIAKCGPLVSSNFYTPPGVALTVADTVPSLTAYSLTLNTVTGTLAGAVCEAYVFIRDSVLTLYAGKKVGDLALVWVSQEQGDVQILGYVEGAPPAPMANLTNKPSYAGATSITFNAPTSLSEKYQTGSDDVSTKKGSGGANYSKDFGKSGDSGGGGAVKVPPGTTVSLQKSSSETDAASDGDDTAISSTQDATSLTMTVGGDGSAASSSDAGADAGAGGGKGGSTKMASDIDIGPVLAAFGLGIHSTKMTLKLTLSADITASGGSGKGGSWQKTSSAKLDEGHKYTVRLEGAMAPYTGDTFMASLNSLTTTSTTPGTPASKTPILPNPNLGGFTTSNPPATLPKTAPTEERFGQRMFVPSPYGQAFVTSKTLDVYQQILLQTNTTYGFVRIPDPKIPRDLNILSFRMSSKYLRPGVLDGMIGYQYNAATLPSGARSWQTSTGQLSPIYDGNFQPAEVGHNASYMRVVEAYQIKKQIDQQAYSLLAQYRTYNKDNKQLPDPALTPGLDFYNEYVWSSRGGTEEVKHSYTTSYEEVYVTTSSSNWDVKFDVGLKIAFGGQQVLGFSAGGDFGHSSTQKRSITYSGTTSFDITASFDGLENDTQMRYAANNDAHFVMNFNSMFNSANQSGINLVAGSDGLVYQIAPSVTSGAGLPTSDNRDTAFSYQQPQPSYTSGNANGLTGILEPYDRPGKTRSFRTYAFFLQPKQANADDFWNTVVDRNWLANSGDPDAIALAPAQASNKSIPWRLFYRVTDSERFLPPISTASAVTPQITPIIAVPVTNPVSDFLFQAPESSAVSALNPHNDVEANVVLIAPTTSGLRIGTLQTAGAGEGQPALPNNVLGFDIAKNPTTLLNWGDSVNAKLLSSLSMSVNRQNLVQMVPFAPPASTKLADVTAPGGAIVYSVYQDPNGFTVNVPAKPGTVVYQDVNSNPIQYYDGKTYYSLQADYIATEDGTITYYIQPPSTYDQTVFSLVGDDDLYGSPGDQWRYYLVSGVGANMTANEAVKATRPFLVAGGYTGFTIPGSMHSSSGALQVAGYVLVQGLVQWPNLNITAESFADVQVYKSLSVLDTFPIGGPDTLIDFLKAQYPGAPFVAKTIGGKDIPDNSQIELVFAKNIITYFNALQQALVPI